MRSIRMRKHFAPALVLSAPILFLFAVILLITPATAQKIKQLPPPPPGPRYKPKPTPTPEYEIVRISSNLVVVPVSVTDAQGQPVLGLKQSDFHLEEDGRAQEITQLGDPEQVPLDIVLLFDISSSVREKTVFAFQKTAAATFLKQVLRPNDRAAVFTISDEPRLVQPLAPAEKATATLLAIPTPPRNVPTAFYDSVSAAAQYLVKNSAERPRRVIVVVSDGDDNFSSRIKDLSIAEARAAMDGETTPASQRVSLQLRHQQAVLEVERAIQGSDATFYSINPGGPSIRLNQISMRAENAMASMATATGGAAFAPSSQGELNNIFQRIASEIRSQYLLQYYSNNESNGRTFRHIAVSTPTQPQVRVRAREGYYPKAK